MSWKAASQAKRMNNAPNGDPLTSTEKYVLLLLADYYNDERGMAWPSLSEIAKVALITRRSVVTILSQLQWKGAITVENRHAPNGARQSNVYRFPWFTTLGKSAPKPSTPQSRDYPTQVQGLPYPREVSAPPNIGIEPLEETLLEPLDAAPSGAVARTKAHEPSETPLPDKPPRKLTAAQLVINAYLVAVGRDPFAVGSGYKQHLAPGNELMRAGTTPEEVAACTECLMTDHWRQSAGKPPTLADVAAYMAMWKTQGCPYAMPVVTRPGERKQTQRAERVYAGPSAVAAYLRERGKREQFRNQSSGDVGGFEALAVVSG